MNQLFHSISADGDSFGPGTDLIVSLVAVLILMLAINTNAYRKEMIAMARVLENQKEVIDEIARQYDTKTNLINENRYSIATGGIGSEIIIENELTMQRFTFGAHILFNSDNANLKPQGSEALTIVGVVLKGKLDVIKEIQIQGHADPRPSKNYNTNLDLASARAIAVFNLLQTLGISPQKHIMSATSFGEYKPVQRGYSDMAYSVKKLALHNDSTEKRELNRRIEIELTYRLID